MNTLETLIGVLALVMAVPMVSGRLGRPALAYAFFALCGMLLAPLLGEGMESTLEQVGRIGFMLLLFEVGLEIDLPKIRELLRPLRFATLWVLVQLPVLVALALIAGLTWSESLLAAVALAACSVGMAYPAWKNHAGLSESAKGFVLQVMVVLEVVAIVFLAAGGAVVEHGFGWLVLLKLAGIGLVVFLTSQTARRLHPVFEKILERSTRWRVHWLLLVVLLVCAVGERLGLSGAKTAFFLGLFMSRVEHDGKRLEQFLAPVSQRLLIPVFFLALGAQIPLHLLVSWPALLAFATAIIMIGWRGALHRRWFATGGSRETSLLFSPNLTVVALAAGTLISAGSPPQAVAWLLFAGLFITITALTLLPARSPAAQIL